MRSLRKNKVASTGVARRASPPARLEERRYFRPRPRDPSRSPARVALHCLHTSLRHGAFGGRRSGEERRPKGGRAAGQDRYPSLTVDPGLVSPAPRSETRTEGSETNASRSPHGDNVPRPTKNPAPRSTWLPATGLSIVEERNPKHREPVFFSARYANAFATAHLAGRGTIRRCRTERR